VLFEILGYAEQAIEFETRSGKLTVERRGELLAMDFPALRATPCIAPAALATGLGQDPAEVLAAADYIAVFDSEATVRALAPDLAILEKLDLRGVCVTAAGSTVDFVSRFFAPKLGVPEDPVTGSAHCALAPYWSTRLGKTSLSAQQVSRRGGAVACEMRGERVILLGRAVTFMVAEIDTGI
jgi:predicted PhzF superfamily epimerase YddE/YHI9